MKDLKELLQQFDDIQDIPVSEEVLGAYMEGRLEDSELERVAKIVESDNHISEMIQDASETITSEHEDTNHPWDIYDGDYGFGELGLTPVLSPKDIVSDSEDEINEDFWVNSDRFNDAESLYQQNAENSLGENLQNLNVMAKNSKTIIYGEAGQNISDPVYVQQPDDHSCALRSQQIVLRDFGIDIPFKDLEQIALENGVYTNEGTYTYDIGKVLQLAGVGMHQTEGNTVDDLINELVHGHRVIVSVDAHELWYNKTMGEKMLNWFKDAIGLQGGNHALIVAGVEIDPTNPKNSKVILTDPGAGHLRIEYPMEQFKDAWGDSNCFMAATNDPAPYQYDASLGKEVPSNFAVQQYINDFVANNSYQLSPDMINVPDGYQPAFTDHLDMVGQVDFDTFESTYQEILDSRIPSSLTIKEQIEELARTYIGETAGSVGDSAGSVGESTGSVGETAGSVGETAGSVGETTGSVGESEGDSDEDDTDIESFDDEEESEDEDDKNFTGENSDGESLDDDWNEDVSQ